MKGGENWMSGGMIENRAFLSNEVKQQQQIWASQSECVQRTLNMIKTDRHGLALIYGTASPANPHHLHLLSLPPGSSERGEKKGWFKLLSKHQNTYSQDLKPSNKPNFSWKPFWDSQERLCLYIPFLIFLYWEQVVLYLHVSVQCVYIQGNLFPLSFKPVILVYGPGVSLSWIFGVFPALTHIPDPFCVYVGVLKQRNCAEWEYPRTEPGYHWFDLKSPKGNFRKNSVLLPFIPDRQTNFLAMCDLLIVSSHR